MLRIWAAVAGEEGVGTTRTCTHQLSRPMHCVHTHDDMGTVLQYVRVQRMQGRCTAAHHPTSSSCLSLCSFPRHQALLVSLSVCNKSMPPTINTWLLLVAKAARRQASQCMSRSWQPSSQDLPQALWQPCTQPSPQAGPGPCLRGRSQHASHTPHNHNPLITMDMDSAGAIRGGRISRPPYRNLHRGVGMCLTHAPPDTLPQCVPIPAKHKGNRCPLPQHNALSHCR